MAKAQPSNPAYAQAKFRYSGLAHRQIRLLRLLSLEQTDDLIECEFHCFDLDSCPPYAALSYVWGEPAGRFARMEITISGYPFRVRRNLWNFLQQAKSTRMALHRQDDSSPMPEYLWIDALCIDQDNIAERNHQVQMMRDIYLQVSIPMGLCHFSSCAERVDSGVRQHL
jgi:hypothetical protein